MSPSDLIRLRRKKAKLEKSLSTTSPSTSDENEKHTPDEEEEEPTQMQVVSIVLHKSHVDLSSSLNRVICHLDINDESD